MSQHSHPTQRLLVVGEGPRATTIADLIRDAGHQVRLVEPGPDQDDDLRAGIADVEIVVEVSSDTARKRAALERLSRLAGLDTLLVSVTRGLSATDLAFVVQHPSRFAALVVHDQVEGAATIEIVPTEATDETTVASLVEFVESLPGRSPLVVEDRPGFLINSLVLPYLNDVVNALAEELASVEDIDVALQLGLGYRTGPLAMLDRIGLEEHLHATEAVYEQSRDPRYAPPPLLRRMVSSGRRGGATGAGFHYSNGAM